MDTQQRREDAEEPEINAEEQREANAEGTEEKRKKYYSPNEVMKRKGCIGCGGAGIIVALTVLLALCITLL